MQSDTSPPIPLKQCWCWASERGQQHKRSFFSHAWNITRPSNIEYKGERGATPSQRHHCQTVFFFALPGIRTVCVQTSGHDLVQELLRRSCWHVRKHVRSADICGGSLAHGAKQSPRSVTLTKCQGPDRRKQTQSTSSMFDTVPLAVQSRSTFPPS